MSDVHTRVTWKNRALRHRDALLLTVAMGTLAGIFGAVGITAAIKIHQIPPANSLSRTPSTVAPNIDNLTTDQLSGIVTAAGGRSME